VLGGLVDEVGVPDPVVETPRRRAPVGPRGRGFLVLRHQEAVVRQTLDGGLGCAVRPVGFEAVTSPEEQAEDIRSHVEPEAGSGAGDDDFPVVRLDDQRIHRTELSE